MKEFFQRRKLHILRAAGALSVVLLAVVCTVLLRHADRAVPETVVADKPFQGLNLTPVPLRRVDAAPDGTGGGQSPEPVDQPEPQPEELPAETPDPTPSGGGTERREHPDAPADRDDTDDDPPRMQLVTDLTNRTIDYGTLRRDALQFYAYLANPEEGAYLRVLHGDTRCTGTNDRYTVTLHQGENLFTLLIYKGGTVVQSFTKTVIYRAPLADEDTPTLGDDPPTIITNLTEDPILSTSNRNFTLTVRAYNSRGTLYHDHIRVRLNGVEITQYTGSETLEYQLFLTAPEVGDVARHKVEVTAWDDYGNSTHKVYYIDYQFRESGEPIGTASVYLDASVLGLGILTDDECEIYQDEPASHVIQRFLEDNGYAVSFSGSLDVGFYLRRITCGDVFSDAEIPSELQTLLALDGFSVARPAGYKDSLGEFDYTEGSGWMYSVNGYYHGVSLSNVYLSDGDRVTLAFTLSYGKDIGGGDAAGSRGNLRTYCGTWLYGQYTEHHTFAGGKCTICGKPEEQEHQHTWQETVTRAATCTDSGEKTLYCPDCQETRTETVPPLGHDYRCTGVTWTVQGESCTATFACPRCGDSRDAAASLSDGTLQETGRTAPTCTADGYVTYVIAAAFDGKTVTGSASVTLPAIDHSYADGVCTVCGKEQEQEEEQTDETN